MRYIREDDRITSSMLLDICKAVENFRAKYPGHACVIDEMYSDSQPGIVHIWLRFVKSKIEYDGIHIIDEFRQFTAWIKGIDQVLDLETFSQLMKPVEMCVYCDSTGLYTEEEINSDNLTWLEFPRYIVESYIKETSSMTYEEYLNEYSANDTDDLYDYAVANFGFKAQRQM